MVITLIGYRGSGKSSVGRQLAQRLNCSCIDSDDVIEERAGRSIREIFEQDGEDEFRRLESEVLGQLTERKNVIIAAGGGAILTRKNRDAVKGAGPVVWLQADVNTLTDRIMQDVSTADRRPNLTDQSVTDEIAGVLRERWPLYDDAASICIETEGQSVEQIVDAICGQLDGEESG